jgi:hypothetical protein
MEYANTLDGQMYRFGFWSVLIVIASGIASGFMPLDVPGGYAAAHADRVLWLQANRTLFIAGWVNQIVAMFSLSGVFACSAWLIARSHTLRAMLAAMVVFMSVIAFIIPKFMAIWTIPLLGDSIANSTSGHEMAAMLLPLLNVSIPFSLYTSFDYLGFWLYALFGLLVAGPLFSGSNAQKIAAIALGSFGLIYQVMMAALLLGGIDATEIEDYFLGLTPLLIVAIVAAGFVFRGHLKSHQ